MFAVTETGCDMIEQMAPQEIRGVARPPEKLGKARKVRARRFRSCL